MTVTNAASDSFEADILDLIFKNIGIANIGDATGLPAAATAGTLQVALHTADPGESGFMNTSEAAYTSYARVGVTRGSGWTRTGNSVSPAANIDFPACTGGTATITHATVGYTLPGSGATKIIARADVTPNISVSNGVTPRLTTATAFTLD